MRERIANKSVGDLEGLKVAHDFEELGEGDEKILTLKDSRILDNEGPWYCLVRFASITELIRRG